MSELSTHLRRAEEFAATARSSEFIAPRVEMWFQSAYQWIEACAAKARVHIMKHQRVPDELLRNPTILGEASEEVAKAFRYLDNVARSKFVYGSSGTRKDLDEAQRCFEVIEERCRARLK